MVQNVAIIIFSSLVAICSSLPETELINEIFNTTASERVSYVSCGPDRECVPRYLCIDDEIDPNNVIIPRMNICGAFEMCCRIPKKTVSPTFSPAEGCGYRDIAIDPRIYGDDFSYFGEFPWMVAILDKQNNAPIGGGSLIAPNVILTGALKVHGKVIGSFYVRAGEWDAQSTTESLPHQDRQNVSEIIIHENFKKRSLQNNIALLILGTPFQLALHINTICLPPPNDNFDNSNCHVSGWGKDSLLKKSSYSRILKKIDLPMVANNQCERKYRRSRAGPYFDLHESFVCAGGEIGKDACIGDGGSPLVCPIPGKSDRYYQVGIVAWGLECGTNLPGVYTNIPHLRTWIDENLSRRNISLENV